MTNYEEIQKKILIMYKEVLPILEDNNINFVACGGTCLGACRDKGFIPWDDDMDINIIPEDWKKLVRTLKSLSDKYKFKKCCTGIYKLIDTKVLYKGKPIFIDFMRLGYVKKMNKFEKFISSIIAVHILCLRPKGPTEQLNKLWIKWPIRITTFFIPIKFSRWIIRRIIRTSKKEYLCQYRNLKIYRETMHNRDIYFDRTKKDFEDSYVYVPKQYDLYLTKKFGDWNKPVDWNQDHYE